MSAPRRQRSDVGRVPLRRAQVANSGSSTGFANTTSAPRSVSSLAQYAPAMPLVQIDDAQIVVDHVRGVAVGPEHRDDHRPIGHRRERRAGGTSTTTGIVGARACRARRRRRTSTMRTAGSSSSATSAVTNGTCSANAGRNARRTTAHENNVPRPDTGVHVERAAARRARVARVPDVARRTSSQRGIGELAARRRPRRTARSAGRRRRAAGSRRAGSPRSAILRQHERARHVPGVAAVHRDLAARRPARRRCPAAASRTRRRARCRARTRATAGRRAC